MLKRKVKINIVVLLIGAAICMFVGVSLQKHNIFQRLISAMEESTPDAPENVDMDTVHLTISDSAMQVIAGNREKALAAGKLLAEFRDEVTGTIGYNGENHPVELRLKGDWKDHWSDEKRWSFKIKVKQGQVMMGMKKFNLQRPFTRGNLNEWVFHQILKYNGLIHLRYRFVRLIVNTEDYGVYAIEEHFDKRLIEHNELREGPIFKLDTDMYWYEKYGLDPELLGSPITPFGIKKGRDSVIYEKFMVAKDLFQLFKEGKIGADEIFDVKKMGRFMAIVDLFGHHHANGLDNMKFYFNPVSYLVEPIGYDQSQLKDIHLNLNASFGKILGQRKIVVNDCDSQLDVPPTWMFRLFSNREFFKAYVSAFEEISSPGYVESFFDSIRPEMEQNLLKLKVGEPSYEFEGESIMKQNVRLVNRILTPEISVHAYVEDTITDYSNTSKLLRLSLANVHSLPVEISHIVLKDSLRIKPSNCDLLQASSYKSEQNANRIFEFEIPSEIKFSKKFYKKVKLHYSVLGSAVEREVKVQKWNLLDEQNVQELLGSRAGNLNSFNFIRKTDFGYRTVPGQHNVDRTMVLEPGSSLEISGGTNLIFNNGANLLCHGSVHGKGTSDQPISIKSDGTSGGILVIGVEEESSFYYTSFDGQRNFVLDNWKLTGAINFYESNVTFDFCNFSNNVGGDDLLNIFRSHFTILDCTFENSDADAFDGDFVRGGLSNVSFKNIGNDGVDFSGSQVQLKKCSFTTVADKAISAGEGSNLNAYNCEITGAELAVNSKDNSEVHIHSSVIANTKVAYVAFEKKAEFGPGFIHIRDCNESGVEEEMLLEKGSTIVRNGKVLEANKVNVKEILYGNEYGKSSR